eukprot:1615772-Amphidinium_carterae.1
MSLLKRSAVSAPFGSASTFDLRDHNLFSVLFDVCGSGALLRDVLMFGGLLTPTVAEKEGVKHVIFE